MTSLLDLLSHCQVGFDLILGFQVIYHRCEVIESFRSDSSRCGTLFPAFFERLAFERFFILKAVQNSSFDSENCFDHLGITPSGVTKD